LQKELSEAGGKTHKGSGGKWSPRPKTPKPPAPKGDASSNTTRGTCLGNELALAGSAKGYGAFCISPPEYGDKLNRQYRPLGPTGRCEQFRPLGAHKKQRPSSRWALFRNSLKITPAKSPRKF